MYKGAEDIKNSGFNKISNISFNSNTQHFTQFNIALKSETNTGICK